MKYQTTAEAVQGLRNAAQRLYSDARWFRTPPDEQEALRREAKVLTEAADEIETELAPYDGPVGLQHPG